MSLPHALLGVLNWQPLTGYELKKRMDRSTQYFWHAELSQIYPILKQLEADGLVEAEVIPQDGKPDKKVYSITAAGKDSLKAWLAEPLDEIPPMKNPVVLKLFFSGILGKEALLAQLRCQLEAHRARLMRIQHEAAAHLREAIQLAGQDQESLMRELVRQFGEWQAQTAIRWLETAMDAVKGYEEPVRLRARPDG